MLKKSILQKNLQKLKLLKQIVENFFNKILKKQEVDYFFECSGNLNMIERF